MRKQKILITGAHSLLGKYIINILSDSYSLVGTTHSQEITSESASKLDGVYEMDITRKEAVSDVISKVAPDILIHLAGISNIDFCEKNPEIAEKINVAGTTHLVDALRHSPVRFLFASSNAIFDGTSPPYSEADKPNPLNIYGKTKYTAEDIILSKLSHRCVIRFTTILGWPPSGARGNDLSFYTQQLRGQNEIFLVNDRFFNPISSNFAAETISKIILSSFEGILHVGGNDRVSRYTLVEMMARAEGIKLSRLHPVKSSHFPSLAPRPIDATLSIKKLQKAFSLTPPPLIDQLSDLLQNRS